GRLAGTMRVSEMLKSTAEFAAGEWVDGEAWRNDPRIGLFVILERRYVGLVPAQEPHELERGDAASFRIATVLGDGKVTLSLRGHALDERENDAHRIVSILRSRRHRVGDHTSPERIRACFGMSKKAFKRALGLLLKEKRIAFDPDGNVVIPSRRRIIGERS
ncbi:MAG: nucleic acid-binding protein, partial [Myxococcota bacterium]